VKQFMAVIVLLWIIAVGCSPAAPPVPPQAELEPANPTQTENTPVSQETLSPEIKQAVLQEVGKQQNVAPQQLQITGVETADWPDACLGLAGPNEMCAQMITPGWAVTVTDGQKTWQYRTDLDALQVKLAE